MNDRWLIFKPVIPSEYIIGILFCLGIFFLWFEYKKGKLNLIPRASALVLMLTSLGIILIVPFYKTTQSSSTILITPEYSPTNLDSLLKLEPDVRILHTANTKPCKNSKSVDSNQLSNEGVSYILGQGLTPGELDLIKPGTYNFLPSAYPSGLIHLSLPKAIYINRNNILEGVFHNTSRNEKIILLGPGGKEDSMVFTGKKFEPFKLKFSPKQPGDFLYTILAGKDQEKIPVHVQKPTSLNILFIQEYPSFESRQLKAFLGRDHKLLLRYRLSRNKFRYEYINRASQTLQNLNNETLSAFDLLITDTDALQALSSTEVKNLQSEIKNGLGILILFNNLPSGVNRIGTFLPITFHQANTDTAQFFLEEKKIILPAWSLNPVADAAIIPTLKNKNRILAGYCNVGFGKTGFQLLQQTYQLVLKGDSASYSEVWSDLIRKTARTKPDNFSICFDNIFPVFPDEPYPVEVVSAGIRPILLNDNVSVPLSEDIYIDDVWRGKFWGGTPGWHELKISGDSIALSYYVFRKGEWQSLSIANQIENTLLNSNTLSAGKELKSTYKPLPQWIFYFLFLMSAGLLWLYPKL